jgi:hypothetical protein
MSAIWVALSVINATGWLLPDLADKFGWGLRVRLPHESYLRHEYVGNSQLEILLINRSKEERVYIPREAIDLNVVFTRADSKPIDRVDGMGYRPAFLKKRTIVPAGACVSSVVRFRDYFVLSFGQAGECEVRATLETAEGHIFTPAVNFRVVEPAEDAILASHPVPSEGEQLAWPKNRRERVLIQQIKMGNRVFLYYRRLLPLKETNYTGYVYRMVELPGKCEMTVEGSYGESGPLTITYKTSPTAGPTKLVVHSTGGRPWTEKDEQLWQELRAKNGLPPLAPPPRVIKP